MKRANLRTPQACYSPIHSPRSGSALAYRPTFPSDPVRLGSAKGADEPATPLLVGEAGLGRIVADVLDAIPQVNVVADDAVVGFTLPQRARSTEGAIEAPGGELLSGSDDRFELPLAQGLDDGMAMVGHDDEGGQFVVVTVEMAEAVGDDGGHFSVT